MYELHVFLRASIATLASQFCLTCLPFSEFCHWRDMVRVWRGLALLGVQVYLQRSQLCVLVSMVLSGRAGSFHCSFFSMLAPFPALTV